MKIFDILLAQAFMPQASAQAAAQGASWNELDEDGYMLDVVISGVTEIPAFFFYSQTQISSWTLPDGIETIGVGALASSSIGWNDIPQSIVTIKECGLSGISTEGTLHLPNVQTVGTGAFSDSHDLTVLTLGSAGHPVTSIGEEAFAYTTALDTLTIYVADPLNLPGPGTSPYGFVGTTLVFEQA